jgi:hypothetical protein
MSDGIEARNELQPIRQDTDWKKHSARDAGNSQKKPFGGIAPLEEQKVTRRKNPESGESEQRDK